MIQVTFRADTPAKHGGLVRVTCKGEATNLTTARLTSLCDLAFRLNRFTGVHWELRGDSLTRTLRYEKTVHRIEVGISPPSIHEKAEAFLTLVECLGGRLYDADKRKRAGLLPVDLTGRR